MGLGHADRKLLEHAAEELEIGELDGVDADIVAELDDDELFLGRVTWTEHVSVLFGR